jgi:hypothetical protein
VTAGQGVRRRRRDRARIRAMQRARLRRQRRWWMEDVRFGTGPLLFKRMMLIEGSDPGRQFRVVGPHRVIGAAGVSPTGEPYL